MVFEFRPLDEIEDSELDNLVTSGARERQRLEFKANLGLTGNAQDDHRIRQELLVDIASLANAEGGYLIFGIGDDGRGQANGYSRLTDIDARRIRDTLTELVVRHISERIEGLEIRSRMVNGNHLVLVRVPVSARIPHMVTYNDSTIFATRHDDGKRRMTIGEIRSAFNDDLVGRMLFRMENEVSNLSARIINIQHSEASSIIAHPIDLSDQTDGRVFIRARKVDIWRDQRSLFWLIATPLRLAPRAIDLSGNEIEQLLMSPPECRHSGWNMALPPRQINRHANNIVRGDDDRGMITVWGNGCCEFLIPITSTFCWPQPEQEFQSRPRFSPYAMCEFPSSFFKLFRALVDQTGLEGPFISRLAFKGIRNFTLSAGHPSSPLYGMPLDPVRPFPEDDLILQELDLPVDFSPDSTAYKLASEVYSAFGHRPTDIPFYDDARHEFNF